MTILRLSWDDFKAVTKMADIKSFSLDMEAEMSMDPTNARNEIRT